MQDHPQPVGVRVEHRERVVVGRPGVDDQRLAGGAGQLDLGLERPLLILARRVVAVVVEAGLADRHALLVAGQRLELGEVGVVEAGASLGCRPIAAYTWGKSSAAASAARHEAPSVPTVTIRVTPAASAAATSSATGGSQAVEMGVAVDHARLGNSGSSWATGRPPPPRRNARPA